MTTDFNDLIANLKDDEDGVWQSILNEVHKLWGKKDHYNDYLTKVEHKYGPLAEMAVMLSKYNYQVCNGGHLQYFDNGYASRGSNGCFMANHEDIDNHEKLIKLVEEHLDIPLKEQLLKIMKDFEVDFDTEEDCDECGGLGRCEEEDGEGGTTCETCYTCNGTGTVDSRYARVIGGDPLDSRYYKINDKIVEQVTAFYEGIILNGSHLGQ